LVVLELDEVQWDMCPVNSNYCHNIPRKSFCVIILCYITSEGNQTRHGLEILGVECEPTRVLYQDNRGWILQCGLQVIQRNGVEFADSAGFLGESGLKFCG